MLVAVGLLFSVLPAEALGQGQGPKIAKQQVKQVNKEGRKLSAKGEQAAETVGRNAIYCLLAAHTDVGTGQELKDKFEGLTDVTFGAFVAAVFMSEITEIPVDDIIAALQDGRTFGEIGRDEGADMGEIHRGFADFRLEVIRTMTHPPTRDCFAATE